MTPVPIQRKLTDIGHGLAAVIPRWLHKNSCVVLWRGSYLKLGGLRRNFSRTQWVTYRTGRCWHFSRWRLQFLACQILKSGDKTVTLRRRYNAFGRVTWGSPAPLREKLCIFVSITCRCIIVQWYCWGRYTLCMTHVSERLNNQNVSYNKFKMCSNKTVLPHTWGKTAPRLG